MHPIACLSGGKWVTVQVLLSSKALNSTAIASHHWLCCMASIKELGSLCEDIASVKALCEVDRFKYDIKEASGYGILEDEPSLKLDDEVASAVLAKLQW